MQRTQRLGRGALLGVLLIVVAWVVAACGGAPAPASTVPQELVVGAPSDSYRTDAKRANVGMFPINAGIYETLVRMTADYQVEPLLATSWEFVAPNTWRFKLRQGIKFHDGQPFNAEAVKVTLNRIAEAGGGTVGVGPDSVKVVDDSTVEITPARPNMRLLQQIVHPTYSVIAPGSDPAAKPVGTGPFKFIEYVKGDHITVEGNPDYWGEKAKLSKITFRFIPDDNSRVLALKAGEVQLITNAPRELTDELRGTQGLKVVTSKVGAYEALYVNIHGQEPYDLGADPAVREAIALAIDKNTIVKDVWRGNAEVNSTMIPVQILGSQASVVKGSAYNAEQAKQVLEQAGWRDTDGDGIREKVGRKLSLIMVVGFPTPEIHRPMPEIVQAQLKQVGVEVTLEITPDTASYEDRLKTGNGDLWAEIGNQNDANSCFLPDLLFYSKVPPEDEEGAMYARAFAPGAAFDTAIEACRSAVTTDDVAKSAAEAMRIIIDQERVVIPIAGIFRILAMQNTVEGFDAHPSGANQRWDALSIAPKQ
jgi:peptide/nickel transport system substrate-binding protein